MQIRTLFFACMFVLAAIAGSLCCGMLIQAATEYHRAAQVEDAVDVSALLLASVDRLMEERPAVGDKLLADGAADAESLARLSGLRQGVDHAFTTLQDRLMGLPYAGAAVQREMVGTVFDQLVALRVAADDMIRRPRSERTADFFISYIGKFNNLLEKLDAVQDLRDVAAAQHDGKTMDLIDLARQVWSARSIMGKRTVPLMAAIGSAAPLSTAQLERQAQFDGQIEQNRAAIAAILRRVADVPGLQAAIATATGGYNTYDREQHEVLAASRAGHAYPFPAVTLGQHSVQAGSNVLALRDAALAAARARVEATRAAALRSVGATCAVVLLILAAMLAILVLLGRRIVTPVLALTEVITRLAGRDYAVAIPAGSRDEIGRMAGALETLRRGAIAAEQAEVRVAHQARHDALTGLSNRVVMKERIEQAIAAAGRGQASALLCLDLDRFKAVNDNFGHPVGDRLLRHVAERLLACVRDVDTVSRLGGDEFSVLLTCLETGGGVGAGVVAERIIRALCEPFELDGLRVSIGASIGIAVALQDGTSADALAISADTALYRAKLDGKGCYRFFVPEMGDALRSRMALEQDLREAVRSHAFDLLYQPQFHLESERITGFEALLRWRHPTRGLITASEFMPLAEETRLIVPLGGWLLRQACTDAMLWPKAVKLSVNLTVAQVRAHDLTATVQHALAAAGLPASRLDLEVTEAALLIDSGTVLHALHDLGVSLSMDNFGTLSSSLSQLESFPFGKVKLDRSLIRGLSPERRSAAIIRAVVGLGSDFGMIVSAVGVETASQLDRVRREGCTEVQGELCGRAIPAEAARLMAARGFGLAAAG